jgi:ribosomal-protein-alanine N-acetyltransferase
VTVETPASLAIRDAEPRDLEAIVAIERASFSDPWSLRSFSSILGRREAIFRVAERPAAAGGGAEIVGFFVAYAVVDQGELANVAVTPSAHRQGIGRRLVEAVIAEMRQRGVQEVFLEVRVSNVAARALYAALGFAEVGRRARYYDRPVEVGLVLRRQIV